jgi:hypothetical protein
MLGAVASLGTLGCDALPRRTPRLEPLPAGTKLDPPPPPNVLWLRFDSARVPPRARDGQSWDEGGGLPDPVATLSVDGAEVLRSAPASDTLEPVWEDGARGNLELPAGGSITLELLDDDGLRSASIAKVEIPTPSVDAATKGVFSVELGSGTVLRLRLEPAHPMLGLGFSYECSSRACRVTRLFRHGPAARAGLRDGDDLVSVDGRAVAEMKPSALRELMSAVPTVGLRLQLLHQGGASVTVQLPEGPVYPLISELGPID